MTAPESKLRPYLFGPPGLAAADMALSVPPILDQAPFAPKTVLTSAVRLPKVLRFHPDVAGLVQEPARRVTDHVERSVFIREYQQGAKLLPTLDYRTSQAVLVILQHILGAQCL